MTLLVSVFSPHPEISASIATEAGEQSVLAEDHPSGQDFTSSLYRDRDRVGVLWSPGPASGAETVRRLRMADVNNVLLVLMSEDTIALEVIRGRVMVLAAGADDVQPWPIDPRELVARIRALRHRDRPKDQTRYDIPGGFYDAALGELRNSEGARVSLTKMEITILGGLMRRRGAVLSRSLVMSLVYGEDSPNNKIIDVYICKLRKKLLSVTGDILIENVWGAGYRIPCNRSDAA